MSNVLLEFHDGRISTVSMPAPGTVTISFSHLCGYVPTDTPELFDVKRCQAEIIMRGATRLETELAVNRNLEVADGTITIDGAAIEPRAAQRFTGACKLSLELAGPFIGKLVVEGAELELLVTVGETFEQFQRAID